jgi:hypothetical protein
MQVQINHAPERLAVRTQFLSYDVNYVVSIYHVHNVAGALICTQLALTIIKLSGLTGLIIEKSKGTVHNIVAA